jgi:hypothetical protein
MSITIPVTLVSFTDLVERFPELSEQVKEQYNADGDFSFGEDVLATFTSYPGAWVITAHDTPVGLFGLHPSKRADSYYETVTYIFADYRTQGYNRFIKRVAAQAFANTPGVHLCSVIPEGQDDARLSLEAIFPGIHPVKEECPETGSTLYVYDFSRMVHKPLLRHERELFNTLLGWPQAQTRNLV